MVDYHCKVNSRWDHHHILMLDKLILEANKNQSGSCPVYNIGGYKDCKQWAHLTLGTDRQSRRPSCAPYAWRAYCCHLFCDENSTERKVESKCGHCGQFHEQARKEKQDGPWICPESCSSFWQHGGWRRIRSCKAFAFLLGTPGPCEQLFSSGIQPNHWTIGAWPRQQQL